MKERKNAIRSIVFLTVCLVYVFFARVKDAIISNSTLRLVDLLYMIALMVMLASFIIKKEKNNIFAIGTLILCVVFFINTFDALSMITQRIFGYLYAVTSILYFLLMILTLILTVMFFSAEKYKRVLKIIVIIGISLVSLVLFVLNCLLGIVESSFILTAITPYVFLILVLALYRPNKLDGEDKEKTEIKKLI